MQSSSHAKMKRNLNKAVVLLFETSQRLCTMENNESAKEDKLVTESTSEGMVSYTIAEKGRAILTD